jgi:UDP-N-acetylmuramoyl-L-alanyl-D-glutamate--2,6-diaminopimelate ligase
MRLSDLIGKNGAYAEIEITGLALDSRKVEPGFLFAALPGTRDSGVRHIPEALSHGAVAVLTGADAPAIEGKTAVIRDANPRLAFSRIAARYFSPQPKTLAAVTGTNGKTSTVHFIRGLWEQFGRPAASVGTLGIVTGTGEALTGLTTPDPVQFHETLQRLAKDGIERVAVEASSHGLSQYRLDGAAISIAAFTNLTQDHLDYHTDEGAYFKAKARLFTDLLQDGGTAVINLAGPFGKDMLAVAQARNAKTLTVGPKGADLELVASIPSGNGQTLTFIYRGKKHSLAFPVVGGFQAENVLLAAAAVIASGEPAEKVFAAIPHLRPVPGRMELVGETPSGGRVYVDYAHTPDGLEKALNAAKPYVKGKLHVVFGCGGDRDKGKRPKMGAIAKRLTDAVYVTDDNPRTESAKAIRAEILAACHGAKEFDQRAGAIRAAVAELKAGDVLMVTGKGNETGQIVGQQVLPFSDAAEVKAAIAALNGGAA